MSEKPDYWHENQHDAAQSTLEDEVWDIKVWLTKKFLKVGDEGAIEDQEVAKSIQEFIDTLVTRNKRLEEIVDLIEPVRHTNDNGADTQECPICGHEQPGFGSHYGIPGWEPKPDTDPHAPDCPLLLFRQEEAADSRTG